MLQSRKPENCSFVILGTDPGYDNVPPKVHGKKVFGIMQDCTWPSNVMHNYVHSFSGI